MRKHFKPVLERRPHASSDTELRHRAQTPSEVATPIEFVDWSLGTIATSLEKINGKVIAGFRHQASVMGAVISQTALGDKLGK